jgi:hypothetical protein
MAKEVLGEAHDILINLPSDILKVFDDMRGNDMVWSTLKQFVIIQKGIKLDQIYRLRRPKSQDDILKNALDHEYYAARISSLVVLLQVIENAGDELERRDRAAKRKKK